MGRENNATLKEKHRSDKDSLGEEQWGEHEVRELTLILLQISIDCLTLVLRK